MEKLRFLSPIMRIRSHNTALVITFVNNLCSGLPLEESLVAIGLFPGKEKAKSKFYILNVE